MNSPEPLGFVRPTRRAYTGGNNALGPTPGSPLLGQATIEMIGHCSLDKIRLSVSREGAWAQAHRKEAMHLTVWFCT